MLSVILNGLDDLSSNLSKTNNTYTAGKAVTNSWIKFSSGCLLITKDLYSSGLRRRWLSSGWRALYGIMLSSRFDKSNLGSVCAFSVFASTIMSIRKELAVFCTLSWLIKPAIDPQTLSQIWHKLPTISWLRRMVLFGTNQIHLVRSHMTSKSRYGLTYPTTDVINIFSS